MAEAVKPPADLQSSRTIRRSGPTRSDAAIAVVLGTIAASIVFLVSGSLPAVLLKFPAGNDIWFEGDLSTVTRNLLSRWTDQSRNANHPIFPLLAATPVYALRALNVDPFTAVRLLTGVVAGVWVGLLFVALSVAGR